MRTSTSTTATWDARCGSSTERNVLWPTGPRSANNSSGKGFWTDIQKGRGSERRPAGQQKSETAGSRFFCCGRSRQAAGKQQATGRRLPEQMAGTSNRQRRQKQGREQVTSRGGRWPASFGHREKQGGWVVPKYVPIRPVFEGCAEIAAYKSETVCDYRGADFAITQFGRTGHTEVFPVRAEQGRAEDARENRKLRPEIAGIFTLGNHLLDGGHQRGFVLLCR